MKRPMAVRDAAIVNAYASGASLRAVGRRFGIGYQRVQRIVGRDCPSLLKGPAKESLLASDADITRLVLGGLTPADIARDLHVTLERVWPVYAKACRVPTVTA